jgi:hypothetical protein
LLLTLLLALLAGAAGAWIGLRLQNGSGGEAALHDRLHDELDLTASQERSHASEEAAFAARKRMLEQRIRAANADLAAAMHATGRNGPEVQRAIDRVHHALGDHQKETVAHVFRMRSVLTAEQAKRFDAIVSEALTADAQ